MAKGELKGVKIENIKGQLHLVIDPKADFGPSSSGKTVIVATTSGGVQDPNSGIFINLTAYRYAEKK